MAMARALLSYPRLLLCPLSRGALTTKRNGFPSGRLPGARNFVVRGPSSHGSLASIASMVHMKAAIFIYLFILITIIYFLRDTCFAIFDLFFELQMRITLVLFLPPNIVAGYSVLSCRE